MKHLSLSRPCVGYVAGYHVSTRLKTNNNIHKSNVFECLEKDGVLQMQKTIKTLLVIVVYQWNKEVWECNTVLYVRLSYSVHYIVLQMTLKLLAGMLCN